MKRILDFDFVRRLERQTSPHVFPRSIVHFALLVPIRSLFEYLLRSLSKGYKPLHSLKVIKGMRQTKQAKSALVLASGPSLSTLNIERVRSLQLSGHLEVFALNNFHKTSLADAISPDFFVVSDPEHHPDSGSEWAADLWAFLGQVEIQKIFFPRNWFMVKANADLEQLAPFEDRPLERWTKNINPTRPRGYPPLTSYKAISIANFMGYKDIFVLGLDHSVFYTLTVDQNNVMRLGSNHSGQSGPEKDFVISSFYPGGVSDYLFDEAYCSHQVERSFRNARVTNLNPNSIADAFPKGDPLGLVVS